MLKVFSGEEAVKEIEKRNNSQFLDLSKEASVLDIVEKVKTRGDAALIEYTKKFDGVDISDLKVSKKEIEEAYKSVKHDFIETIQTLGKNIGDFHKKQKEEEWFEQLDEDAVLGIRNIPLDNVGVYVPGGRASYPSSVLMNVIPAKVAGVQNIFMASPPPISPYVLVAAEELQVKEIYKVGGAQAIAAFAYGTETVKKVDKIVGPGNAYVALAKKAVSFSVGIDSLAGPSDILIIADCEAEAQYVAADLLSQAEHDPESSVILITESEALAKDVLHQIEEQIKKLKRKEIIKEALSQNGKIFLVKKIREASVLANMIAPEHLEIMVSPPQKILENIKNAGAVFLGPYSPVPLGDYGAGPNHVLPTFGTARFSSPLGVYDFIKRQSFVGYTKGALSKIRKDITKMAEIEGLDAHKRAIEIRFS